MSDGTLHQEAPADGATAVGPATAGEERAQAEARRFRVVAIVAGVLFAPQVVSHLAVSFYVVPTFKSMFVSMGGALPPATAFIVAMGPWLGLLLLAIDVLLFWGFARLARTYWIGLLFAPLFATGLVLGPVIWFLYTPMFEVINLVR